MKQTFLPYHQTGYFSKLLCDYLAEEDILHSFYHRFPTLENFEAQVQEKQQSFSQASRKTLVDQLIQQYKGITASEATLNNIDLLSQEHTFTVTTGHQLNLFTGPLYFLYKIFSVINLSEELAEKYPQYNFVPIYWMASEDHDFEEIQYFHHEGTKITWDTPASGAVGRQSLDGLDAVFSTLEKIWGTSNNAQELLALFKKAYLEADSLSTATRILANQLFAKYGLVIIDGDDAPLKKAFMPYAKKELTENLAHKKVSETSKQLVALGYKEQVHPRAINLFYLDENIRERIIERDGTYFVNNTEVSFSREEILDTLETHPERFSPNALLRPLYQEVILPNICYTGGGGELAYWFQLKDYFNTVEVPFPVLLLRNSVVLVPQKIQRKLDKLEATLENLFKKPDALKTWYTHKISEIKIDFSTQKAHLVQQFKELYSLAEQTDASFLGAVGAQEKKQLNGLDHLEKRLLKAQKRKLVDQLNRLLTLQMELFPNGSLQERYQNFSYWYLLLGPALLDILKNELQPLANQFTVLEV